MSPVLVVHGGAWAMPDDMLEAHKTGMRNALNAGWAVLQRGGSALDAVEEAIVILEDDETFDAGRGSFLNREGKVQMDALLMDGSTLRAGGVGCVERVKNPVRAARKILSDSPHVYFVGEGAERFAEEHGIKRRVRRKSRICSRLPSRTIRLARLPWTAKATSLPGRPQAVR